MFKKHAHRPSPISVPGAPVQAGGFPPLSLAIPDSAAAAVRVGASCRVNGAPLSVASVKERHDGLGVIASFGVALNSPLTSTLSTMTAGASVRLEVETDAAEEANGLDVVDVATSKRMREMQDGLPGTREWYNQALPWYSKMYPTGVRAGGFARRRKRSAGAAAEARRRERGDARTRAAVHRGRRAAFTRAGRRGGGRGCGHDARAGGYRRGHVRRRHSRAAAERAGTRLGEDDERRADERRARRGGPARVCEPGGCLRAREPRAPEQPPDGPRRDAPRDDREQRVRRRRGDGRAEAAGGERQSRGAREDEETKAGVDETATETSKETESDIGADAVRENSVEVCVMSHPGALCCTRSEVATDATKGAATITLHTSVRAVNGAEGKMAPADFVALARARRNRRRARSRRTAPPRLCAAPPRRRRRARPDHHAAVAKRENRLGGEHVRD